MWAGWVLAFFPGLVFGQVAILQIRVVEGEGGVHPAGSRAPHPIVVEITDETGRPVEGAIVSFRLPEDGPGGVFTNGLRTDVATADARGRAALRGLRVNRTPGRFQIRIIASKEQARAGTVSLQYVAGTNRESSKATASGGRSGRKWWLIAAVAGAAVAGGVAARGSPGAPPAVAPPALTGPPGPVIGVPTVTVGKP
jgi:hypothetical protein